MSRNTTIDVPPARPQNDGGSRSGYRGPLPRESDPVERLSWLMDRSIPLPGGFSIGLDPIIGLVPGFGDLVGTAVSGYIVYSAHKAGIPRSTMLRMVANVGIDAVLGSIPFVGDVFDFVFKANSKNVELYREALAGRRDTRRDTWFLVGLLAALGVIVAIPILAVVWALQHVF